MCTIQSVPLQNLGIEYPEPFNRTKGLSGFIKKVLVQLIRYKLAGATLLKRTNQKIKSCVKGSTPNFGMFGLEKMRGEDGRDE